MGLIYSFTFQKYKQTMQENLLYMLFGSECFMCNKGSFGSSFGSLGCETDISPPTEPDDKPVSSNSMRRTLSIISDLNTGKVTSTEKVSTPIQPLSVNTQNDLLESNTSCVSNVPLVDKLDQIKESSNNNMCARCNYLSEECRCVTEQYGSHFITHIKSFDDVRQYKDIRKSPQYNIRMANNSLQSTGSGDESNSKNYNREYSGSSSGRGGYSHDAFGHVYM